MSVELLPHNQKAYKNVKEILKINDKVAVVHPTGSGKSFIALKLMEENPDKKVIYLSPSVQIMNQLKNNMVKYGIKPNNIERITYQKLTAMSEDDIAKVNGDIIVLDEFHHCGAPKWGETIQNLLKNNPNAKVLGLSATPMRYFDGNIRDMAEELFEENIASEISLSDAIADGILKAPNYTTGIYEYEEIISNLEEKINECNDSDKRKVAEEQLQELKEKLEEAVNGIPELLENSMSNENGKYIVYCKNIKDMQKKMEKAQEMFGKVNSNIEIMSISSDEKDVIKNSEKIRRFEDNDNGDSLKLLFSVDMLNEGYHLKDLDGVIMMRPTHSPTLYYQQLGRALSVGNSNTPTVIDLVNNIDTIEIIENFANELR